MDVYRLHPTMMADNFHLKPPMTKNHCFHLDHETACYILEVVILIQERLWITVVMRWRFLAEDQKYCYSLGHELINRYK